MFLFCVWDDITSIKVCKISKSKRRESFSVCGGAEAWYWTQTWVSVWARVWAWVSAQALVSGLALAQVSSPVSARARAGARARVQAEPKNELRKFNFSLFDICYLLCLYFVEYLSFLWLLLSLE